MKGQFLKYKDSWTAEWKLGALHITGTTEYFPNDFSTASLVRRTWHNADEMAYTITFHRDKEPFSDHGVGTVSYHERSLPPSVRALVIHAPDGEDSVSVPVPPRRADP